jgi:pimeloyl-ACP methyl ester carboxylesterase
MNQAATLGLLALNLATASPSRAATFAPEPSAAASPEVVVLVHGLLRSDRSMAPLAKSLEDAGYRTVSLDYPTTKLPPEELVEYVDREVSECCSEAGRVHFVTHSLGGLVVRGVIARHRPAALGRVVMLAPPNHGSEWVDRFGSLSLFRMILGPTAVELGTAPQGFPQRLPPPDYEVGVIAGTTSYRLGADSVLGGANDGTVSVASTRLDGMTDFATVEESHTFIMRSDTVAELVRTFLRAGRFHPGG